MTNLITAIEPSKLQLQLQAAYNSMRERHSENTEYRMQNYFNCIDDYSWGGIQDQTQSQKENRLLWLIDRVKEQDNNGGFLEESATELILQSSDGAFVSANIVRGKWGKCFMWGSEEQGMSFLGLSTKQSTFAKKGYRVVTKKYRLKVIYNGRITQSGNFSKSVELIEMIESVDSSIDTLFDNKNYNLWVLNNQDVTK